MMQMSVKVPPTSTATLKLVILGASVKSKGAPSAAAQVRRTPDVMMFAGAPAKRQPAARIGLIR
jgi:hypothetical protein